MNEIKWKRRGWDTKRIGGLKFWNGRTPRKKPKVG
jgi:hypothetical protein